MMLTILVLYSSQIRGGLAVSLKQLLIQQNSLAGYTGKKVENISKCFFEKSFHFNDVSDIPVIKGHLALNIPKRASHNSF